MPTLNELGYRKADRSFDIWIRKLNSHFAFSKTGQKRFSDVKSSWFFKYIKSQHLLYTGDFYKFIKNCINSSTGMMFRIALFSQTM